MGNILCINVKCVIRYKTINHYIKKKTQMSLLFLLTGSGVSLTLNRDRIYPSNQDPYGQLTCRAKAVGVALQRFSIFWVKVTGESTELMTVSRTSPIDELSRDGFVGNGTMKDNTGHIFLDYLDNAMCEPNLFLCEATFRGSSGKVERAVTLSWPSQPRHGQSDQQTALETAEMNVATLSEALNTLNTSHVTLQAAWESQQKLITRVSHTLTQLETKIDELENSMSCRDACSNMALTIEDLEGRVEALEESGDDTGSGECVQVRSE